jgi:hypothetical protein
MSQNNSVKGGVSQNTNDNCGLPPRFGPKTNSIPLMKIDVTKARMKGKRHPVFFGGCGDVS